MEQLKHQARCTKTDFSLKLKKKIIIEEQIGNYSPSGGS